MREKGESNRSLYESKQLELTDQQGGFTVGVRERRKKIRALA